VGEQVGAAVYHAIGGHSPSPTTATGAQPSRGRSSVREVSKR
jgi:hypothetical protein